MGDLSPDAQVYGYSIRHSSPDALSFSTLTNIMRIKQDFWGAIVLSIDFSQSVDEKANVPYPTELASKGLDLSIERFSGSVGAPSFKVI